MNGTPRVVWNGGFTSDGEYRLHGRHGRFYEDGREQWEVSYDAGRKTGDKAFWVAAGRIAWTWKHGTDGASVRTMYWSNGRKKSETRWRNLRAAGMARRWDPSGRLLSERRFVDGFSVRP